MNDGLDRFKDILEMEIVAMKFNIMRLLSEYDNRCNEDSAEYDEKVAIKYLEEIQKRGIAKALLSSAEWACEVRVANSELFNDIVHQAVDGTGLNVPFTLILWGKDKE